MKIGRGVAVQRHLGQLFEGQSVAGLGEAQLLERFVERRDDPAFAALVARHGPMVLGVCRRLLADPRDVEDAFQATFLVLVRRAGTLRGRDRLAPWLFGVARRVAARARSDAARRRAREVPGLEEAASAGGLDDQARELGRALVEEIDRLPGPLRDAILLCCVEGLTYDEAATRLGSTAPAVRGKLARARERLRGRLTRRGFAPGLGGFGVLLAAESVSAALPPALLTTTTQVAKSGMVPVGVEILAEGVIRTMFLTKSKIIAAALVACGFAGSSVGLVAQDGPGDVVKAPARADRLDQVEKKLDRVLQALEGKPDRRTRSLPDLDNTTPGPAVAARAGQPPIAPPSPDRPPIALPSPSGPPAPPAPPSPAAPRPGSLPAGQNVRATSRSITSEASGPDRMSALEKRLERLEARLSRLERAVGRESGSDVEPASVGPLRVRTSRPREFTTKADDGTITSTIVEEVLTEDIRPATAEGPGVSSPTPTPSADAAPAGVPPR